MGMAQGIVIRGKRLKPRFFFFLIMILGLTLYIIRSIFKPPLFGSVQHGELTSWIQCTGVVIRQESVYTAPDYGEVDFFVSQGQLVEKDALLAILYKDDFNRGLIDELYNVRQKIVEHQNRNIADEIMDEDFQKIQRDINEVLRTIQYSIQHDSLQGIQRQENHLRGLLNRRKDLLDKVDLPNAYLEQLFEDERDIESKLDEWKIEILAPETGLVSFDLDGLENLVTPDSVGYLTPEQYQSFKEHEPITPKEPGSIIDDPLFKIVTPDIWYVAILIPHRDVYFQKGDSIGVNVLGLSDTTANGIVYRIDSSKDSTLLIIEIEEDIDMVLGTRNVQVEVGRTTQGLMVPKTAVSHKKGTPRIRVNRDGEIQDIEVAIKAADEEWVIIERVRYDDKLELNDSILIQ